MESRVARRLVRLYPRTWRARYEREMLALIDDAGLTFHRAVDLLAGATAEWARVVLIPEVTAEVLREHPTLVRGLRFIGGTSPFIVVALWRIALGFLPPLTALLPFAVLWPSYFALLLASFLGARRLSRNLSFLGSGQNGSKAPPIPRTELCAWFALFTLTSWTYVSVLSGTSPWFIRELTLPGTMLMPCFSLFPHVIERWFVRVTGEGVFYLNGPHRR